MRKLLIDFLVVVTVPGWTEDLFSQNVGIGTIAPHASAALEIQTAGKGVLIPRMAGDTTDPTGVPNDMFGAATAIDETSKRFLIGEYNYAQGSGKVVFGKIN